MSRDALIAAKEAVRNRIAQARSRLERERQAEHATKGHEQMRHAQRAAGLEADLDALMAEEARLRVLIDRSR